MPVTGEKITPLTAESILSKTTDYDIYRYYLGMDFTLGRAFLSPFRKEVNPSFSVNIGKKGNYKHFDYTNADLSGNCFDFVMQLLGIGYGDALKRIDFDMGLGIFYKGNHCSVGNNRKTSAPKERISKFFQVTVRNFNKRDLEYWAMYGIQESELKQNNVYAVRRLRIDKQVYPLTDESPTFGYFFDGRWKIYRPLSLNDKWLMNVAGDTMSGLHRIKQGCDTVIVTKSKKDEILLAKFLPYVCSVQQESTIAISSSNISLLSSTCNRVLLNFDSDKVGVQSCKHYNQYGFGWVNCPKGYYDPQGKMIKDFADLARYYGLEEVKKHFKTKGII
jgi:hypothetical protein